MTDKTKKKQEEVEVEEGKLPMRCPPAATWVGYTFHCFCID